jgi:predicted membrane channel-forming protein YqfA (hemolysin III family)
MIQFYRIIGFFLLIASSASLASLLARLIQDLREPAFWVSLLLSLGLGITGTVIYFTRKPEIQDWIFAGLIVVGITVALLIGGLIQWSR